MSFFPRKILLAVDGSEEATPAKEAATELSRNTASEVHLAYVLPTPERLAYPIAILGRFLNRRFTSPSCHAGWRAFSDGRLWEVGWRSQRDSLG